MRRTMCLSTFLILFATALLAQKAVESIVAQGTGLGANRDEALINARRNAVETGIGQVLLSQTEIENFMLKRDMIITKTVGTVTGYEILSEKTTPDNLVEITIKASLSRSALREDLAAFHILIESMNKPRVMVVIAENNVGNDEPANQSAETAIIKFLREPYSFDLVDPQVTATIRESRQRMASLSDNPAEAAAIGAQYGAEMIITGSAVSREAKQMSANLGGMVSVQADVRLRVVNVATGRIIGASDGHGARVHISPNTAGNMAISQAADRAIKPLLDVIIKEWQSQLNDGLPLTVTIREVNTFGKKKAIMQTLGSISAIAATRERSWDAQSGLLELDIQYKGNIDGFCSRMDGFKLKTAGGSFAVTGISGTAVTLVLQAL